MFWVVVLSKFRFWYLKLLERHQDRAALGAIDTVGAIHFIGAIQKIVGAIEEEGGRVEQEARGSADLNVFINYL